jgi:hypothetical protein
MHNLNNDKGVFVISLDFELLWGVWDVTTKSRYGSNITGVKKVIPELLDLFSRYDFKATFAIVGILFAENKATLETFVPEIKPAYSNTT